MHLGHYSYMGDEQYPVSASGNWRQKRKEAAVTNFLHVFVAYCDHLHLSQISAPESCNDFTWDEFSVGCAPTNQHDNGLGLNKVL